MLSQPVRQMSRLCCARYRYSRLTSMRDDVMKDDGNTDWRTTILKGLDWPILGQLLL